MRIIAGRWKGHGIRAPRGRDVRPTSDRVREAWMSALSPRLPGATILDLFAGTGALGLEALSRGAAEVTFVEIARGSVRALEQNIQTLGAGEWCRVEHVDVLKVVNRLEPGMYDIALADPPYGKGWERRLLERFAEVPFASELWVEHRTRDPVPALPGLARRRYGDTTLSQVFARDLEPPGVE